MPYHGIRKPSQLHRMTHRNHARLKYNSSWTSSRETRAFSFSVPKFGWYRCSFSEILRFSKHETALSIVSKEATKVIFSVYLMNLEQHELSKDLDEHPTY